MGKVRNGWIGAGLALMAAPARAECLGSCAKDLEAALLSLVAYVLIGITLLVMLIRARWRRRGLWGLGIVLVLALGVPLVSQGWLAWKLRAVEAREMVGEPSPLAARTPLMIAPGDYCRDDACAEVLHSRGKQGIHVVPVSALEGLDLTGPVALAELPLEWWVEGSDTGEPMRRQLSPAERHDAAAGVDYLVVTSWRYSPADPGPVEAGLRANPRLHDMGPGEAVRLLFAPLTEGEGILSLATLRPDLLDLSLTDRALAIPLAPRNTTRADNAAVGTEAAMRAICPTELGEPDSVCRWRLGH